jgi:hypothetical protein
MPKYHNPSLTEFWKCGRPRLISIGYSMSLSKGLLSDEAPTINLEMAIRGHRFQIYRYRRKIYADHFAMGKLLSHGKGPDDNVRSGMYLSETNTPDTGATS